MSTKSELKLIEATKALYERYRALKASVEAVDASQHPFITDLDLFILATEIADCIGLSQRSLVKWNNEWDARLQKAEVYVEGKQIEYGITPEATGLETPAVSPAVMQAIVADKPAKEPESPPDIDPDVPHDSTSKNYALSETQPTKSR